MMEKFFDDLPEHLSIEEVNRIMDLFEELAKVVREERGNPASLHLAYYASYKMTEYLKLSMKLLSGLIKDEVEKRNGKES
jgi:rRNA maturation protein Rpf1